MNLIEYADDEMMAIDLANQLAGDLRQALDVDDRAVFVVPGGSSPGPVFDVLCDADLDWSRVTVMPSDERWVPSVHIRSNAKLIQERLLVGRASEARFVPLYYSDDAPARMMPALNANVAAHLPISVLLLGMGADMHTASLFPGVEGLEDALDKDAPAVVALHPPQVEDARISLSARVLDAAMAKHLVITGPEKRIALERAQTSDATKAPIATVLPGMAVHWAP